VVLSIYLGPGRQSINSNTIDQILHTPPFRTEVEAAWPFHTAQLQNNPLPLIGILPPVCSLLLSSTYRLPASDTATMLTSIALRSAISIYGSGGSKRVKRALSLLTIGNTTSRIRSQSWIIQHSNGSFTSISPIKIHTLHQTASRQISALESLAGYLTTTF